MKIGPFEFDRRELAGSTGDFGTLFPLMLGYLAVCNLDPAGVLVMFGLANIWSAFSFRLPIPVEPMKVIAAVAIAGAWEPSLVYASGFAMGLFWILLSFARGMDALARITPPSVVTGIQVALGLLLAWQSLKMISSWPVLGLISILIVIALRKSTRLPGAIALIILGLGAVILQGNWPQMALSFTLPPITTFSPQEVWQSMLLAGFSQIPLTAANAVIATAALALRYWPNESKRTSVNHLGFSISLMNLIPPFLGGMPMCHGAGGLAAKYYFGARTGGANIIEGLLEVLAGLFLTTFIIQLLSVFPLSVIGSMLFLVGIELVAFVRESKLDWDFIPLAVTVSVSLAGNMAYGFLAGLLVHYLLQRIR
jgi:MFS superfamily sulfate permease-like transporter